MNVSVTQISQTFYVGLLGINSNSDNLSYTVFNGNTQYAPILHYAFNTTASNIHLGANCLMMATGKTYTTYGTLSSNYTTRATTSYGGSISINLYDSEQLKIFFVIGQGSNTNASAAINWSNVFVSVLAL